MISHYKQLITENLTFLRFDDFFKMFERKMSDVDSDKTFPQKTWTIKKVGNFVARLRGLWTIAP